MKKKKERKVDNNHPKHKPCSKMQQKTKVNFFPSARGTWVTTGSIAFRNTRQGMAICNGEVS